MHTWWLSYSGTVAPAWGGGETGDGRGTLRGGVSRTVEEGNIGSGSGGGGGGGGGNSCSSNLEG